MQTRKLRDLKVSAVGLGCMGFSHGYGEATEKSEAINLIREAHELGCTFFDTAEGYAQGKNEELVGEALKPIRDKVVLATKLRVHTGEGKTIDQVKQHVEASLKRLGTDYIDLYYQHRVNKEIPVEEVAEAMGILIKEGKIRAWGQSQSTEDEIRRANAITPLTAIQSEYSIMERGFEKDVIPTCKELGIGFVPFSPLASGFLSGKISPDTKYQGDDVRRVITRFSEKNIKANQPLLDLITKFAKEKEATPAQVSLAWMLHKEDFIVPIPGSRKLSRIEENLGATNVALSKKEFDSIEEELSKLEIHGNRTDEDIAKLRYMK